MAVAYLNLTMTTTNARLQETEWRNANVDAEGQKWFALQVRTKRESSAAVLLTGKGYQTLLPTYRRKSRRNGKFRAVDAPLFPGYVFCQFDPQRRLPVLVTPGVIAVVSRGRIPLPVDDREIAAVQAIVSSELYAEPCPYLEVGQRVRIERDALEGVEGILTTFKGNHRVVISVSLLRRSVALEIDQAHITPVGVPRSVGLELAVARVLTEVTA